ncbi:MAG: hypothetical protein NC410_08975 [Oscillibacter sp.]|nr:hypothetical protein [Oscillibacter sp.]
MAIIEVPDISVVNTVNGSKQLLSLRDQKIKKDGVLNDFGVGSGVKYGENLYVLKSEKIVIPENYELYIIMDNLKSEASFEVSTNLLQEELVYIDWGDGIITLHSFHSGNNTITNKVTHAYTDGILGHTIKFYASSSFDFRSSTIDISGQTGLNIPGGYTSLDISRITKLLSLRCTLNNLTSLDVSKNPELEVLLCGSNNLTSLDVNKNPNLRSINIYVNPLVENRESLLAFANSLPNRSGKTAGNLSIMNSNSATWIQEILTAKNWEVLI